MYQTDLGILRNFLEDSLLASVGVKKVGLSASACWKRIKRMRDESKIKHQISVFDAERLGFGLTIFINI